MPRKGRQNRQGRVERIVEAYAAKHGFETSLEMLRHWRSPVEEGGEGLNTYQIAERLGCSHQGVSYLLAKYGERSEGNKAEGKMVERAQALGFKTLDAYFEQTWAKTIKDQAKDLEVSEMTIKRYRRKFRQERGVQPEA